MHLHDFSKNMLPCATPMQSATRANVAYMVTRETDEKRKTIQKLEFRALRLIEIYRTQQTEW